MIYCICENSSIKLNLYKTRRNIYGKDNSNLWENMLWKTYYDNQIKEKEKAVILSCDESTKDLFDNNWGKKHDEMALRIGNYFKKKSVELVNIGCTVILDWGFGV